MTNMKIYHIFLSMLLLIGFAACQDDFPGSDIAPVGEGEADLTVTMTFEKESSIDLDSRAYEGGDPGNAIQNINTLHMLVYDEQGYFIKRYSVIDEAGNCSSEISGVKYLDDKGDQSKSKTGRVAFNVRLKSNRYFIYGVANVKNFESMPEDSYRRREDLKSLSFEWDSVTTANNSQMFGVFAVGAPDRNQTDDKTIAIRRTDTQLWCYVKRLASKVTVAFDGSELFDNVEIYISTISVKDVAKRCALGVESKAGLLPDGKMAPTSERYKLDNGLVANGKTLKVQTLPSNQVEIVPDSYLHVCNGKHQNLGKGDENADNSDVHGPESRALYFFENAQGEGKSKLQDINQDGEVDYPNGNNGNLADGWKDQMPYGTYVEVKGYYRCTRNDGSMSYGPITYRFMLGQDTEKDYNVFRNTHYRLTLCFKGYGNEADWHIVYNEPTGIYSMSPQYISYVYLKEMTATVKVVGEMTGQLQAHIMGSAEPSNSVRNYMNAAQKAKDDSVRNAQTYWRPWGVKDGNNFTFPDPDIAKDPITTKEPFYYTGAVSTDGPWNSFISLKKIMQQRVEEANNYDLLTQATKNMAYNKEYWERSDRMLGDRLYDYIPDTYTEDEGNYRVDTEGNNRLVFSVPLYTRGNILVGKTGYTGNNPYESYPRRATVRFAAPVKDPDTEGSRWEIIYVDFIQVRRITNPKAIYYSSQDQSKKFHVTLMYLRQPNDDEYTELKSDGAWSAEVWQGGSSQNGVVALSNTTAGINDGSIMQKFVNRIEGDDECPIDFDINIIGSGYAIVKVRYHNYTCEHDIFVCKDFSQPVDVVDGGAQWSTTNVDYFRNGNDPVLTKSPLDEGSLFRRGVNIAIKKSNNAKYPAMIAPYGNFDVTLPKGDEGVSGAMNWAALEYSNVTDENRTPDYNRWSISGTADQRIATIEDYYTLIALDEKAVDFPIKRAYGVAYGDGTIETVKDVRKSYGDDRETDNSANCMRGVVIYNNRTSKHIFLPLGASGYGRRKGSAGWQPSPADSPGTMRYASRSRLYTRTGGNSTIPTDYSNDTYKSHGSYTTADALPKSPLFYDIYRRPGAIYWCRNRYTKTLDGTDIMIEGNLRASKSSAIDINFHTMGFEGYVNGAAPTQNTDQTGADLASDACFIRTIGYSVTP